MCAVYLAHDPQLDRDIALKLLHAGAPETLINEAKALAKVDDDHVVRVFDASEHESEVFIAMQLVDGEDLATALAMRSRAMRLDSSVLTVNNQRHALQRIDV